jgi:hypothetical protein
MGQISTPIDERAVSGEISTVAARMNERLRDVSDDITQHIKEKVGSLRGDELIGGMLAASVLENVVAGLHMLQHGEAGLTAPNAALEYARRLAQREVDLSALLRAYRVGQTRFQEEFMSELVRKRDGDHTELRVAQRMVEITSGYVDDVVEQIVDSYAKARDEWISHRAAVLVQGISGLLSDAGNDIDTAQKMLGAYRLAQQHLGVIIWCDEPQSRADVLSLLHNYALRLASAAECAEEPLFVPYDESTAWLWLPLGKRASVPRAQLGSVVHVAENQISIALGESLASLSGFRRTLEQANLAHSVALAAKPHGARLTAFADVAPISLMCSDMDAARAWVAETLGPLAMDDERTSILRETARAFLTSGGSFAATASTLKVHKSTMQYRLRKAEDLRGRPLREGRLDVELALLACYYLGSAVLQRSQ